MKNFMLRNKLEILIIAIIVVIGLFFFYYVVAREIPETNESRQQEIQNILSALGEYKNFNGQYPSSLDFDENTVQVISKHGGACHSTCQQMDNVRSCITILDDLVPKFIELIPFDNQITLENNTGYYINRLNSGQVVVGVCQADNSDFIRVTR